MGRPFKCRRVEHGPQAEAFKPAGIPARQLESVKLGLDELEAIRLADLEGLYFDAAGKQMGLSRATFGRLLERARHKLAEALIQGKMLVFQGGPIVMVKERTFQCESCAKTFATPCGTGHPEGCPHCGGASVHRIDRPCREHEHDDGTGARGRHRGGGRGRCGHHHDHAQTPGDEHPVAARSQEDDARQDHHSCCRRRRGRRAAQRNADTDSNAPSPQNS